MCAQPSEISLVIDTLDRTIATSQEISARPESGKLQSALEAAIKLGRGEYGIKAQSFRLELVWVLDAEMTQLNERFTGREVTTDVLAFEDGTYLPEGVLILGEVICNLELAHKRGLEFSHSGASEAALYAVHGIVHLMGGRDKTAEDRAAMRRIEIAALEVAEISVGGGEWEKC